MESRDNGAQSEDAIHCAKTVRQPASQPPQPSGVEPRQARPCMVAKNAYTIEARDRERERERESVREGTLTEESR